MTVLTTSKLYENLSLTNFPDFMGQDSEFALSIPSLRWPNRRKQLVYVSSKYTADTPEHVAQNIRIARWYSGRIWELGFTAICPVLNTAHMELDTSCEYSGFLAGDLELVAMSTDFFLVPNWTSSKGCKLERDHALQLGKPIHYSLKELHQNYLR